MSAPAIQNPVLIIGWRGYLVEAALRLGLAPVVVYGPGDKDWAEPVFTPDVHAVFVARSADAECILTALAREGLDSLPYKGVCPGGEDAVVVAAVIAQALGIAGLPVETAVRARDKWLQKERLQAAGHHTAACAVIPDIEDVHFGVATLPDVGFPAVLKPIDGVGTSCTRVVQNSAELSRSVQDLATGSGRRTFVVESFVPGEEWEIDGVVRDGELIFCSIGVYPHPVWHIQQGTPVRIVLLDHEQDSEQYALVRPFLEESLSGLGITNGVFHLEAFHQPEGNRLVFSECAVRPGGGLIPETVHAKFGVNLGEEHLRAWCGLPTLAREVKRDPDYIGSVFFPSVPGTLVNCPTAAEVEAQPGVIEAVVQTPVGFGMAPSGDNVNMRMGLAVLRAPTVEQLQVRGIELLAWFADRVVVSSAEPRRLPPRLLRREAAAS
ncbi:acetyl-CoA carboxylase biotin carboxylase subunit family protein [Streptomyces virginiae]|uniref:ATP-grasp domain-containing protein n=1 Tax=Streptomyces virginiae TaxID=1961 RepID=UPI00365D7043